MLALVFDELVRVVKDCPAPTLHAGDALVRVLMGGICNTDVEIVGGYAGYRGILGHEFVGVVEAAPDVRLVGQRVVGEINIACGQCAYCVAGMPMHCSSRAVLGIRDRPGAFADYVALPQSNLHVVPATVRDEQAVFCEPLAAALEIEEQVHVHPSDSVIVLGDGKLGALVAQVLGLTGCDLVLVGKHPDKLAKLAALAVPTALLADLGGRRADVVVDCTGQASGLEAARSLVHPRGVIVLKSTFHGAQQVALTPFVVDEVTLVGSRCGPFAPALRLLQSGLVQVEPLISAVYPLADGAEALKRAAAPGVLKVLVKT